jgi:outer membrane protein assembly factor BamB
MFHGASVKSHAATAMPQGHGKILFTAGRQLILVDRDTKKTVWESSGLNWAQCVAALSNGQYLVCERQSIARIDADGKFVSRTSPIFQMTTDVKPLANDRFLVCDGPGKLVAEMDWSGNMTWSVKGLHFPSEAVRLENGNTLVADGTAVLKEFDANGKSVRTTWLKQWAASVARLPDGNTLVGQSSAVDLLNPDGRSIWSLSLPSRITGVQQVSSAEFLICEPDEGRIAIIDANGTVLWELSGLYYPWHAIYIQ